MIKATFNNEIYNLKQIEEYKVSCKLQFNNGKYFIFIPIKINQIENENTKEFISIDPGIRTFMTGISENEIIKIGNNVIDKLKSYHERIDETNKIEDEKHKHKKQKLYRRKIKNLVDELHWKTISILIKKYKNVLIGDMSVKGIVSNESSKLGKMIKRISYSLKFYEFRQRLENKCKINKIGYKCINEKFTSKLCSNCGWENKNLGSNKIFICKCCLKMIDRDVNGGRNIYIKSKLKYEFIL